MSDALLELREVESTMRNRMGDVLQAVDTLVFAGRLAAAPQASWKRRLAMTVSLLQLLAHAGRGTADAETSRGNLDRPPLEFPDFGGQFG